METPEKVTAEFYRDSLLIGLVGAVDVPRKRMIESTEHLGKTICRVCKLDCVDAVLIDENGDAIDQIVVHR